VSYFRIGFNQSPVVAGMIGKSNLNISIHFFQKNNFVTIHA